MITPSPLQVGCGPQDWQISCDLSCKSLQAKPLPTWPFSHRKNSALLALSPINPLPSEQNFSPFCAWDTSLGSNGQSEVMFWVFPFALAYFPSLLSPQSLLAPKPTKTTTSALTLCVDRCGPFTGPSLGREPAGARVAPNQTQPPPTSSSRHSSGTDHRPLRLTTPSEVGLPSHCKDEETTAK